MEVFLVLPEVFQSSTKMEKGIGAVSRSLT